MFKMLEKPLDDSTKTCDLAHLVLLVLQHEHHRWRDYPSRCLTKTNRIYSLIYQHVAHKVRQNMDKINERICGTRFESPPKELTQIIQKMSSQPMKSLNSDQHSTLRNDVTAASRLSTMRPAPILMPEVESFLNNIPNPNVSSQTTPPQELSPLNDRQFEKVIDELRQSFYMKKRAEKALLKENQLFNDKIKEL